MSAAQCVTIKSKYNHSNDTIFNICNKITAESRVCYKFNLSQQILSDDFKLSNTVKLSVRKIESQFDNRFSFIAERQLKLLCCFFDTEKKAAMMLDHFRSTHQHTRVCTLLWQEIAVK